MKLKLTQRIVFGYYKSKIALLSKISPKKAAAVAFELFCTPFSSKRKKIMPEVFKKAEKASVSIDGLTVRGFTWQNEKPNGKKILICHGFDSCSYKFEQYVTDLLSKGFDVAAFDAPAHGISDGTQITALIYYKTIVLLEHTFGPFYGIISHSFGGLAVSLAAEHLNGTSNKKLVLIAPATESVSAMNHFNKLLDVPERVAKEMNALIYSINAKPLDWYSITRSIQHANASVLWIHDDGDRICPYKDTKAIRDMALPNIQFITTHKLGHNKIYHDHDVQKKITEFLCS
jgi:esterase/lipase